MILKYTLTALLSSTLLLMTGCSQLADQQFVGQPSAVRQAAVTKAPRRANNQPRRGPVKQNASKQKLWQQRQRALVNDFNWHLKSKVALRYRTDHWSFGLDWAQQNAQKYVMLINNPITGGVLAKLSREPKGVNLIASDGKRYQDNDEERLLQRQSGIALPLKGMQYWVRGLTSPRYKVNKLVLDAMGRPQFIYQAGWKIAYSRYTSNRSNAMPRKVVITRDKDNVYLKMIAKKWQGI